MQQRVNSNAMKVSILRSDTAKIRQLVKDGFPIDEYLFDEKNCTALYYAVNRKKPKAVETLLQLGASPALIELKNDNSPLHTACAHGDRESVGALLEHDAEP